MSSRTSTVDLDLIDAKKPRPRAVIFGVEGKVLSQAERDFFAAANPLGFIIFARNCEDPAQLRKLTDDLRAAVGRNVPVLVDQEGGRVARMRPPHWTKFPPAAHYGDRYAQDKNAALNEVVTDTQKLAAELLASGVNVNCAPVLDVRYPDTHDAIGDRHVAALTALGIAVNGSGRFGSGLVGRSIVWNGYGAHDDGPECSCCLVNRRSGRCGLASA